MPKTEQTESKQIQRNKQHESQTFFTKLIPDEFKYFRYIIVNSSGRKSEFFCNLFCGFAFLPAFPENCFLSFRQFIDNLYHPVHNRLKFYALLHFGGWESFFTQCLTDKFLKIFSLPEEFTDIIICDGEYEWFEWWFLFKFFMIFPDFKKNGLYQLFWFSGRPEIFQSKWIKFSWIFFIDKVEGFNVTSLKSLYQFNIAGKLIQFTLFICKNSLKYLKMLWNVIPFVL